MPLETDQPRPDPDALLAQVQLDDARSKRGRLKIFFGAAAGVGKTYAMISDARYRAIEGTDVVVGYAEPHARPETEELLLGLELLPCKSIEYRGTSLRELDLEAALKRRPELLLVDELAHTNAPGLRHAKRWQDIEELLQAGINVYTTLNVQHLESLNDVVAQITSVIVRETVPDAVFDNADDVELVDLSPDELLERLQEGKIYLPQQAEHAVRSFFRKSNLTALRELALRKVADRVSTEVLGERRTQSPRKTWPTRERILVCVTPSPTSAKVIRAAKRMAVSLHAEWIVAFVETPKLRGMSHGERDQLHRNFRLAERLGAQTVTLSGRSAAEEIVSYARQRNATKIIAGKPDHPWWYDMMFGSLVDQLLRRSGEIDVYVVRGLPGDGARREEMRQSRKRVEGFALTREGYQWAVLTPTICTLLNAGLLAVWPAFGLANLVMIYLVGMVYVSSRFGRPTAALASVLSVAAFDFFFVPPKWTFAVQDTQYLLTFAVMLGVSLLIATLTARIREQAEASRHRERGTEALYRMTDALAATKNLQELAQTAMKHVQEIFQARNALLMHDSSNTLTVRSATDDSIARTPKDAGVAQWAFDHRQLAGRGTDTLPAAEALYVPLMASHGPVGVLAIRHDDPTHRLSPEQRRLLEAVVNQIAMAMERDQLAQSAREARLQAETENLRSSLLSSVSHDLRTPLAVITGASSSLLEHRSESNTQRELAQTIHDESQRLTRLVSNLLDITRLEAGAVTLNRDWQSIEEVVGSALARMESSLTGRAVKTDVPANLPLVQFDGVLIEQVLVNLLENAVKYTPINSGITIAARPLAREILVEVIDQGTGVEAGEQQRIFEKFFRGGRAQGQRGVGLGLAICRAIVTAHGGRIWVENLKQPDHGAVFRFTLPLSESTPKLASETEVS